MKAYVFDILLDVKHIHKSEHESMDNDDVLTFIVNRGPSSSKRIVSEETYSYLEELGHKIPYVLPHILELAPGHNVYNNVHT